MIHPLTFFGRALRYCSRSALGRLSPAMYNGFSKARYSRKPNRRLEIGPGHERIEGFETLNIVPGWNVDYIGDAAKPLPFADETFEVVYASHVLEHIPWYQTEKALSEWVRVLRPEGWLEVWVPDGVRICAAFVSAEMNGTDPFEHDPWYRFNEEKDPAKWANGRLFTYGDGTGSLAHPNWHRALFSERYLRNLFQKVGLSDVRKLTPKDVRGYDHGWISLGMCGRKPVVSQL